MPKSVSSSTANIHSPFIVKRNLRRQVILGLLIVAILPLALIGSITFLRSRNLLADLTTSQARLIVENNLQQIEELNRSHQTIINQIKSDTNLQKSISLLAANPQNITQKFSAESKLGSYLSRSSLSLPSGLNQIAFLDANGDFVVGTNPSWRKETFASANEPFLAYLGGTHAGLFLNPTSLYKNQLVIVNSWPVYTEENQLLGTFFTFATSELFLNQLAHTSTFFPQSSVAFITQDRQIVSYDKTTKLITPSAFELPLNSNEIAQVMTGESEVMASDSGLGAVIGYAAAITSPETGLLLSIPQSYLVQQIDILGNFNIILLAVSLTAMIGVGYYASSTIVKPLQQLEDQAKAFTAGKWDARVDLNRNDEIGMLSYTFNQMGDQLQTFYQSLEKRVEQQTERYRLASEISQIINQSSQRSEMLQKVLEKLVGRFDLTYACLFFLDQSRNQLILRQQSGAQPGNQLPLGYHLPVASRTPITQALTDYQLTSITHNEFGSQTDHLLLFPDSAAEVCIPIRLDRQTTAVLNIHSSAENTFTAEIISWLQDISNQIAMGWQKTKTNEMVRFSFEQDSPLFKASLRLTACQNADQAYQTILSALQEAEWVAGLFSAEEDQVRLVGVAEPGKTALDTGRNVIIPLQNIPEQFLHNQRTILKELFFYKDAERLPVISLIRNRGCQSGAILPIFIEENLKAILILGSHDEDEIDTNLLDSLENLIAVLKNTLTRISFTASAEKQAVQLRIAAEIARDIAGSLSIDDILKKSVNLVLERFGFYHASVFLMDSTGEFATIQESTGPAGEQLMRTKHRLAVGSPSLVGKASLERTPVVSNDVKNDPSYYPNPFLPETRAELVIPLIAGGQLLGLLDVQSTRRNAFENNSISTLQVLADQLAAAVMNARLFHGSQMHLSTNQSLQWLTSRLAGMEDVQEIFNLTVRELNQIFSTNRFTIYTPTSESEVELTATAGGGYTSLPAPKARAGMGILGKVMQTKQTILVKDTSVNSEYTDFADEVRTVLAIPLAFSSKSVGVLFIEGQEPGTITEDLQEILETWSYSLSAMVENARLMEQIRKQVDRQRKINQVSASIRQSSDVQSILETTAVEVCRALHAYQTQIEINPAVWMFGSQDPETVELQGEEN